MNGRLRALIERGRRRGSRVVALDAAIAKIEKQAEPVPDPLMEQRRRCVRAVARDAIEDGWSVDAAVSRAFAICTASLQRHGYLKPGTAEPTAKGMVASLRKLSASDAQRKHGDYERLLAYARAQRRLPLPGSRNVDLKTKLQPLREAMEAVFSCDTAYGDCHPTPSAGHCMLAAMVVQDLFGGQIVGGKVNDRAKGGQIPHYWNRIGKVDVDVTGDQFGFAGVRIKKGHLHKGTPFDRDPKESLAQPHNREVTKLHRKFVDRLIKELSKRDLCEWVNQLQWVHEQRRKAA